MLRRTHAIAIREQEQAQSRCSDMRNQTHNRTHDTLGEIDAEQGEVIVDGPDGIAFSLTPEAAEELSERLKQAAAKARSQRLAAVQD
jgi:hypothetical protein